MKLSAVKRNVAAAEQGAWIGAKYGTPIPEMGDLNLKVRSSDNADWRRLQSKLTAAVPQSKRITLDPAESDRILNECIKGACLLDWDGVQNEENGEPIKFSAEQAAAIIDNPAYADFRNAVLWASQLVARLGAEQGETDAKN